MVVKESISLRYNKLPWRQCRHYRDRLYTLWWVSFFFSMLRHIYIAFFRWGSATCSGTLLFWQCFQPSQVLSSASCPCPVLFAINTCRVIGCLFCNTGISPHGEQGREGNLEQDDLHPRRLIGGDADLDQSGASDAGHPGHSLLYTCMTPAVFTTQLGHGENTLQTLTRFSFLPYSADHILTEADLGRIPLKSAGWAFGCSRFLSKHQELEIFVYRLSKYE